MINRLTKILNISVLAVLVSACGSEPSGDHSREKLSFPVKIEQVNQQGHKHLQEYPGSVSAVRSAKLSTRVMGLVDAVNVLEGEKVSAGQVLLQLRNQDIAAQKQQAQAAVKAAEQQFKNAETQFTRIKGLFDKSAATRKEFEDTETAFVGAQSQLEAARQGLRQANEALRYSRVVAPFDGVITRKMAKKGDFVNPGQPLLEVSNISELEVATSIPASEVSRLEAGQTVRIMVPAANDSLLIAAKVARIVPAADPMSRQFEVIVRPVEQKGFLKPGMFARVMVPSENASSLTVPNKAVFNRGQLTGVFLVDDEDVLRLRWVRVGRKLGNQVEVLAGLNTGDRVVVERIDQLVDGSKVEVQP